MLTKVADDEFGSGFIPDEVDGHTFLGVATAQGDMFVKKGRLTVIFESIPISMAANDRVRDLWSVKLAERGVLRERRQSMKRDVLACSLRREGG